MLLGNPQHYLVLQKEFLAAATPGQMIIFGFIKYTKWYIYYQTVLHVENTKSPKMKYVFQFCDCHLKRLLSRHDPQKWKFSQLENVFNRNWNWYKYKHRSILVKFLPFLHFLLIASIPFYPFWWQGREQ